MEEYEENYEDILDPEEIDEELEIEENTDNLEGGDVDDLVRSENIKLTNKMEIYKPKITRDLMSIYEFVGTITKLADYLYHLDDLSGIIDKQEVCSYINPLELSWNLLKHRKFNAVLNRGVEDVSFSELQINPRWVIEIENNFKLHKKSFEEDILKCLKLTPDTKK
jgi:hypothetical protein